MKSKFFIILLSFAYAWSFGQGAGNYVINQSKGDYKAARLSSNSNSNSNSEYDYSGYYQQAAYKPPVYPTYVSDTTIQISVSGMINTNADNYIAILGISQTDETIETCHELINKRINDFIESLSALGISKKDVYIDFISQVPIFELELEKKLFSKSYNEIPAGFELKKNLHIRFTNKAIAEKLLIQAAKNEIYDIIKVEYIVSNLDQVYDSIRNECIKVMNRKVEDYKKMGIVFNADYKTVQESTGAYYPIERYSSYSAFNDKGEQVKAGGKKIRKSEYQVNIYYNKYPSNSFDFVMNPNMVDPSVQLIYNVTMKFVLKKQ
ncbi:MAG: hypothetical protein A2W91_18710 [Bacteroidetes bacterium GWF2_38_335]|nr:MAG: hypothetical protein A2W91_18710 [Bacteroidetes bacterium GWF2_38_335]OFY78166.1 MAG: hypothetical protein A2281_04355 [Bacteroidetes bacterium RIFOXYA12_FULL_38_20]HBS88674.1 hypothetical protein [Bacteroidales bacterium]